MPAISITAPKDAGPNPQSPLPPLLRTPFGLALIEIQGTLNLPETAASGERPGETVLPIGRLEFPALPTLSDASGADAGAWMKKVYFYVGDRQRLVGQVKKLEKAFAVLRRREDDAAIADGEALEIVDVVKYKLHFGGRPEFV